MPQQLRDAPPLPDLTAHIWRWFAELHAERTEARAITSRNIIDWMTITRAQPAPWEIRALRAVDGAWLEAQRND